MKSTIIVFLFLSSFNLFAVTEKITISNDLELIRLNNDVYIHVSYIQMPQYGRVGANGLLVVQGNEALLIDTPWNDILTGQLFDWVKSNLKAEIKQVVITHFHDDNMGGLKTANDRGAISYSLDKTKDILKKLNKNLPERTFSVKIELKLKQMKIVAEYPGAGHTVDNIIVWLPEYKILFGGCLIKSIDSVNLGNLVDAVVDKWPETVRKVLEKYGKAKTVVPGHGKYGGVELIRHTIDLAMTGK